MRKAVLKNIVLMQNKMLVIIDQSAAISRY
jgi:hypothetical protein